MSALALTEGTPAPEEPVLIDTSSKEWRVAVLLVEKMREVRFGEIAVKMRAGTPHLIVCTESIVIE